ncbi:hypothetical protein ACJX0J_014089, partial [Zea mays]
MSGYGSCSGDRCDLDLRGGSEFDENLLRKVFELYYENGLLDLSYAPDVGDYLVCEDTSFVPCNKDQAPIPEGMMGTEVEKRLNGQTIAYYLVLKQCLNQVRPEPFKLFPTTFDGADDARKILNNDGTCPICDQVLSKSHMKPMDINPGDDWRNKRIYLPGNPQVPGFIPTEKPTTFDSCAPLIATHPLEVGRSSSMNKFRLWRSLVIGWIISATHSSGLTMTFVATEDTYIAVELYRLSVSTLDLLKLASKEEQGAYVGAWYNMLLSCAQELKHGVALSQEFYHANICDRVVSE